LRAASINPADPGLSDIAERRGVMSDFAGNSFGSALSGEKANARALIALIIGEYIKPARAEVMPGIAGQK